MQLDRVATFRSCLIHTSSAWRVPNAACATRVGEGWLEPLSIRSRSDLGEAAASVHCESLSQLTLHAICRFATIGLPPSLATHRLCLTWRTCAPIVFHAACSIVFILLAPVHKALCIAHMFHMYRHVPQVRPWSWSRTRLPLGATALRHGRGGLAGGIFSGSARPRIPRA